MVGTFTLIFICTTARSQEPRIHTGGTPDGRRPLGPVDLLSQTALGDFISANGGLLPKDLDSLRTTLDKQYSPFAASYGPTTSTVVPFSGAPNYTDLDEARSIFMSSVGDLYFGAIERLDGKVDFEFLSRNKKTKKFDFGIIHDFETNPRVEFVDRNKCMTCHKAGGPIFYSVPWGNTMARSIVDVETMNSEFLRASPEFLRNSSASLALHVAFLERLAQREKKFTKLSEVAHKYFGAVETKHHITPDINLFEALKGKRWHGADLLTEARSLETAATTGNNITFLHDIVLKMESDSKQRAIQFLLTNALCLSETERARKFSTANRSQEGFENLLRKELLLDNAFDAPRLIEPRTLSHLGKDFLTDPKRILEAHRRKQSDKIRNTAPEDSPILDQNLQTVANAPVGDLVESYFASLRLHLRDRNLKLFCESDSFKALVKSNELPDATMVHASIKVWRQAGGKPPAGAVKSCMDCHDGSVPGIKAPFDIIVIGEWRTAFTSDDIVLKQKAHTWRKKVINHLKEGTMPPEPHRSQLTDLQKSELIQYLETFNK